MVGNVEVFDSDDKVYLAWLRLNGNGYVLNTDRGRSPQYMVLHRASCPTINEYHGQAKPGGFTERDYIKICAADLDSLRDWVCRNGRADGSFSSHCSFCV